MKEHHVVVALDDGPIGERALAWALAHCALTPAAHLHTVHVLAPAQYASHPLVGGLAGGAAALAVAHESDHAAAEGKAHAEKLLAAAVDKAMAALPELPKSHIHHHALPPAGGASGVAESLVEYVRVLASRAAPTDTDVTLVLGSRGLGALARGLMGFVGLGSVSDYCAHNCPCPVVVVRGEAEPAAGAGAGAGAGGPLRVLVAADDSPQSANALTWAMHQLKGVQEGTLCVVAVAWPVSIQVLDEAAAVAGMEAARARQEEEDNVAYAREVVSRYAEGAQRGGMAAERIMTGVLPPTTDVGAALCEYAKENSVSVVVLGSRGMGTVARSLMGLVGLGSVSDYCAHHSPCPIAIVKDTTASAAQAGDAHGKTA